MASSEDPKRSSLFLWLALGFCVLSAALGLCLMQSGKHGHAEAPQAALAPIPATPALRVLYDRQARQCKGTTAKGERCKRRTADPSGYCYSHRRQVAPGGVN